MALEKKVSAESYLDPSGVHINVNTWSYRIHSNEKPNYSVENEGEITGTNNDEERLTVEMTKEKLGPLT